MAQHVQVRLVDDVDGSEASETVAFALDGRTYEIDLSQDRAARLRTTLQPYVAAARRGAPAATAGAQPRAERPARRAPDRAEDTTAIRAWARDQGFEVSDRGRIPARVRQAYAQGDGGAAAGAGPEPVASADPDPEPRTAGPGHSLPPVANPFAVPSAG